MRSATTNNVTERAIQQFLDDIKRWGFDCAETLLLALFGINIRGEEVMGDRTVIERMLDRVEQKRSEIPHELEREGKAVALTGLAAFLNGDVNVEDIAKGQSSVVIATYG
jgi:hypothetical protein